MVTEAKRLRHSALGTMSPTGLRAFDRARDGMLLGEGAAFVVVRHPTPPRPAAPGRTPGCAGSARLTTPPGSPHRTPPDTPWCAPWNAA
ncbi:hypothetical protein O1L55_12520 [Streptomyces albulus]|nr:hypothetical protein [Streptomyces noursei]